MTKVLSCTDSDSTYNIMLQSEFVEERMSRLTIVAKAEDLTGSEVSAVINNLTIPSQFHVESSKRLHEYWGWLNYSHALQVSISRNGPFSES
jgi:hypothetical protein